MNKPDNDSSKNIYVVLIKAHTGLGRFVRKITKYEYTHIAVCMDSYLDDFITFSRRKHYAPFDAGFMHEKLEHYAFDPYEKVKLKVFKIPVSDGNYKKIKHYISMIEQDKAYIFNLYSMITMPLFHGIRIYKALNCMSFVTKIISLTGRVNLPKRYDSMDIKDIDNMLTKYFEKEEYFYKNRVSSDGYMRKVSILTTIKQFFYLNEKLIKRLIKIDIP